MLTRAFEPEVSTCLVAPASCRRLLYHRSGKSAGETPALLMRCLCVGVTAGKLCSYRLPRRKSTTRAVRSRILRSSVGEALRT